MATSKKTPKFSYLETWNTRYGVSERIVTRDSSGKILDNVSWTALKNAPKFRPAR